MAPTAFFHGLTLSLGLIAAVGPQNVFVFQQGAVSLDFAVRCQPSSLPVWQIRSSSLNDYTVGRLRL